MTKRVADMTPEEYARHREKRNAYDKTKGAEYKREYQKKNRAVFNASQARYYAANKDKVARTYQRKKWREAKPAKVRELMRELSALAPRHSGRDEIIAAASLLVVEGYKPAEAMRMAVKRINDQHFSSRRNVNFEEAYWL